jgi:DNA-binding response OmpR family regulator
MKPLFLLGTEAQPETYTATHDSCSVGRWVNVSGTEETLARVLLERFGELVEDQTVRAAASADRPTTSNALHVDVSRLRKRLVPLGLVIRRGPQSGLRLEDGTAASGDHRRHLRQAAR